MGCPAQFSTYRQARPRGVAGELYVCSPMSFTAYLGAASLTAERLRAAPAGLEQAALANLATASLLRLHAAAAAGGGAPGDDGSILAYRTGDVARMLPSGALQILGRNDSTVKILGFKVGLSYIEETIGALPGVARAVVVPLLDEATMQPSALVAHVLPDASAAAAAAADEMAWLHILRGAAGRELAAHALPAHWMVTGQLAISDNGSRKLDRKKLPLPPRRTQGAARGPSAATIVLPHQQPRAALGQMSATDALEAAMAPIWAEVLDLPDRHFDRDASFFDLGGQSLLAARLVATIGARLASSLGAATLTVLDLFAAPSLALLTASLVAKVPSAYPPLAPVPPSLAPAPAPTREEDVAIISAGGRFPGAPSVDELWAMLVQERVALQTWSPAELRAKGVLEDVWSHPNFVPAAYLIEGAQYFDAQFWGISPHEARLMDPQHRVFLEVVWQALEHAGIAPRSGTPARTSVFASTGIDGYMIHHLEGKPLKDPLSPGDIFLAEVGSEKDYIATRVSYALAVLPLSLWR